MTISDETLANVAKWLDLLDDTDQFGLQWLLLPQGEHAVRARLVEMEYDIEYDYCRHRKTWRVSLSHFGDVRLHQEEADTPTAALVVAVAQLAGGGG
jgi:hypothetical protein